MPTFFFVFYVCFYFVTGTLTLENEHTRLVFKCGCSWPTPALKNEPRMLVFEGGCTWFTPPPLPLSKPSRHCSFSRAVASSSHHHHCHPQNQAVSARFQGRLLLPHTTTTATLETEQTLLVFEGSCFFLTPPPLPPSKPSIHACF